MTHQPTQLLSRVGSGPVGVCVIGLQLDFLLHYSLIPDSLVSTVELGWVMCHGLYSTVSGSPYLDCPVPGWGQRPLGVGHQLAGRTPPLAKLYPKLRHNLHSYLGSLLKVVTGLTLFSEEALDP